MARPAKWKSPTTAIRVPKYLAEELLSIARTVEAGDYVQNTSGDRLSLLFAELDRRGWFWSGHQNEAGVWFSIITGPMATTKGYYQARYYPTLIDAIEACLALALQMETERTSDDLISCHVIGNE